MQVIKSENQVDMSAVTSLKGEIVLLADKCKQIAIVDEGTLAIGQQNLAKANSMVNTIEGLRTTLKAPYLAAGKLIDSTCKQLSEPLTLAVSHLKEQALNWEKKRLAEEKEKQEQLERKFYEEQEIIRSENERRSAITTYMSEKAEPALKKCYERATSLHECNNQISIIQSNYKDREFFMEYADQAYEMKDRYLSLIEEKKKLFEGASQMSEAELSIQQQKQALQFERLELEKRALAISQAEEEAFLRKQQEEAAANLLAEQQKQQAIADSEKTKGIRYTWDFELVDITMVPKEWICLDEKAVKAYMKESIDKEGTINGVRFFKKMNITA
jgi:hypothetical protein